MTKELQIVTKGVSFNVADPDQKRMLNHALQRTNFSAYIKRLIQRDMDGWGGEARRSEPAPSSEDVAFDDNLVGDLL